MMAKTFLDLQNAIAEDLTRSDLTADIKSKIGDAIDNYATSRFYFNVTRSLTFSTVANQSAYGVADMAQIPDIIEIDNLFLFAAGGQRLELEETEVDEFEWLQSSMTGAGIPTNYCYVDSQILLWPVPLTVYTVRPHMHYKLPPLVADSDSNAWCNDAEQLIRCHAKLLLYANVIEDADGMQRMQLQIQPLLDRLSYKTSARSATGQIRGTAW